MKEIEMIRVNQLASLLSTTDVQIVKLCEKFGVPIIKACRKKIRMVSRELFLKKTEREGRQ